MRYHALDDPEISDAEYDALFQALVGLEKDHPDLVTPNSPTQRVGAPPIEGLSKSSICVPCSVWIMRFLMMMSPLFTRGPVSV